MNNVKEQEKIISELSEKFQKFGEENMMPINFRIARFCDMIANSYITDLLAKKEKEYVEELKGISIGIWDIDSTSKDLAYLITKHTNTTEISNLEHLG